MNQHDPVHSPSHYTKGIETIDYIEAKELGFHEGNAVKYISRTGAKSPGKEIMKKLTDDKLADTIRHDEKTWISMDYLAHFFKEHDKEVAIQDLEKSLWYVTRKIKNLKEEK